MSFELHKGDAPGSAFASLVREQIRNLQARGAAADDPERFIHFARVRCKRVRAGLALFRNHMSRRDFRRLDRWWREAGRRLSELRDAAVRAETLETMGSDLPPDVPREAWLRTARRFSADRRRALSASGAAISEFLQSLADAPCLRKRDVRMKGRRDLAAALGEGYRSARKAMRTAFGSGEAEDFHAWRRAAKRHAIQMGLASRYFPGLMVRAQKVLQLEEALGSLQDFEIIGQGLPEQAETAGDAALRDVLDARREQVIRSVTRPGKKLFGDRPRTFVRSLLAGRGQAGDKLTSVNGRKVERLA